MHQEVFFEQTRIPMQQDCEGFEAIPDNRGQPDQHCHNSPTAITTPRIYFHPVPDNQVAEPKVQLLHEYIKTLELESEQKTKVIKDLLLMLESQQQQIKDLQH